MRKSTAGFYVQITWHVKVDGSERKVVDLFQEGRIKNSFNDLFLHVSSLLG